MKFTEEKLEKAFIELLGNENFPHHLGISIVRAADEVLIEADLLQYLLSKYESKQLTVTEAKSIVLQLKTLPSSDLYESNKIIMRWLSDGFILKREDRSQKDIHIELIDYNGLDAQLASLHLDTIVASPPENYGKNHNIYKFVNQLEIVGSEKRIPDGIIYINGLPVVVFEFKSAIREEATIFDAFNQLTIRYRRDIPELFKYNAFCVISDGVNNKAGSFFAPYEFFYGWRRVAGLAKDVDGIDSMFTLVQGMFQHDRLRDIIRNFIYIPDSSKKNEKIVCRYPQYYAAKRLYDSIKLAQKPQGNGKGGTYFGATGCGKSFTMLYLTRLLMKSKHFESPTIVLITDRTDLDTQLSETFVEAKKFIGDNTIVSVESRANLRELLQGRQSGAVFLTTIHKFTEDTEIQTNLIHMSGCLQLQTSQVNLH
jgi:type I restriction enzyme R subunit